MNTGNSGFASIWRGLYLITCSGQVWMTGGEWMWVGLATLWAALYSLDATLAWLPKSIILITVWCLTIGLIHQSSSHVVCYISTVRCKGYDLLTGSALATELPPWCSAGTLSEWAFNISVNIVSKQTFREFYLSFLDRIETVIGRTRCSYGLLF